jgi:hypothetical protein
MNYDDLLLKTVDPATVMSILSVFFRAPGADGMDTSFAVEKGLISFTGTSFGG